MSWLRDEIAALVLALQFMTRLPLSLTNGYTPERAHLSVHHYPLVGVVIGVFAAGVYWVASLAFAPGLAALLAVASAILLTGALHEDGLADVCDGLGGSADRERALAIMRDSRIGAYGVIGLVVVLAAKVVALAELPPGWALWVLVAAHAGSRAAVVMVMSSSRYVRGDGAASEVAGRRSSLELIYAGVVAAGAIGLVPVVAGLDVPSAAPLAAVAGVGVGSDAGLVPLSPKAGWVHGRLSGGSSARGGGRHVPGGGRAILSLDMSSEHRSPER